MPAARAKPFRLIAPVVPEHAIQKAVADVLRLELAPPGKVSKLGVVWYSIDHAAYSGEVPGLRIGRGIIAGILDLFVIACGRAHFIELKTPLGELSEAQRSVCSAVLAAGGLVGVARDAGEVLALLDAWGVPRAQRVRVV